MFENFIENEKIENWKFSQFASQTFFQVIHSLHNS